MILEFILKIKSIFIIKKNATKVKKRKEQNIWRKSCLLGAKKAKIAMIQKDIGVSDMAERLGNNRSYISSVLNGRVVSPPIRKRISDYLNITDDDSCSDD